MLTTIKILECSQYLKNSTLSTCGEKITIDWHHSFSEHLLGVDWFDWVSHTCLPWTTSLNEGICLVTSFSCNCYSICSVTVHLSGSWILFFVWTWRSWLGCDPSCSTQFDHFSIFSHLWGFSEYSPVSLWPCWRVLVPAQASRRCWRGLVWALTPALGPAVSSAAAHAFPSELVTICWPLKTEQISLKIDKLGLACTEPVSVFQSGTDRIAPISWERDLIQQAANCNTNVKRATLTFVSWVWCFITTRRVKLWQ